MDALISIIIPVYKTEPYLRKCLDSVIGQTYKNIEILLIDNGSPDGCGAICDDYAAKDSRIRLVHLEKNAGVNHARNLALDMARGDYIAFTDSDDWCELDLLEYLMGGISEFDTDIAVCAHWDEYENGAQEYRGLGCRYKFDRTQALRLLLGDWYLQSFLWEKLWKRDLFEGLRFQENLSGLSDFDIMPHLFLAADGMAYVPEAKYHYLQRQGSVVHSGSLGFQADFCLCYMNRHEFVKAHFSGERFHCTSYANIFSSCLKLAAVAVWHPREFTRIRDRITPISAFFGEHAEDILRQLGFGRIGRMQLRALTRGTYGDYLLCTVGEKLYQMKRKH